MKVVGLISGGKDSCYNMMQCVAEGHQIVALANLKPQVKDELDSYMYQTVGHHAIDLYAEAMDLPLYRRTIQGSSVSRGRDYVPSAEDEVEDLHELLLSVKRECDIEAVAVGAILSDYQRVRVEHVCMRLGLTPLAYLWRRDQEELLHEMINCQVHAIIIKVAAIGLTPEKHLGKTIAQIYPHMVSMKNKYSLNVCGEGGEYETFTLDCPLFKKRLVLDEAETVIHSDDAFAPVAYLNLKKLHLEPKTTVQSLDDLPMLRSRDLLSSLSLPVSEAEDQQPTADQLKPSRNHSKAMPGKTCIHSSVSDTGFTWLGTFRGTSQETGTIDLKQVTQELMETLKCKLEEIGLSLSDLVIIYLQVDDMKKFAEINSVYKQYFSINPPCRVCVETCLPRSVRLQLDCLAFRDTEKVSQDRHTMHVQGLSHWAPANIGPYSQAVKIGPVCFTAGQIGMQPSDLAIIEGGIRSQGSLSLRHAARILEAMGFSAGLLSVVSAVCFVTHPSYIPTVQAQWRQELAGVQELLPQPSTPGYLTCVVVPHLPKDALVEWQVYAHSDLEGWKGSDTLKVTEKKCTATAQCAVLTEQPGWTAIHAYCDCEGSVGQSPQSAGTACDVEGSVSAILSACKHCLDQMHATWAGVTGARLYYKSSAFNEETLMAAFFRTFQSTWGEDTPPRVSFTPVTSLQYSDRVLALSC